MAVNRDDFLSGLAHLIPVIEDRLHQAKHFCAEGSLDDFVEKKIGCLYGIAQAYNKCFLRCEVKDKAALERLAQSNFRHGDVRDAMHELDDAERELDRFLLDLDRKLDISKSATLTTGQLAPLDIPLIDARSNEPTSLRQYLGQENMVIILLRHFA